MCHIEKPTQCVGICPYMVYNCQEVVQSVTTAHLEDLLLSLLC